MLDYEDVCNILDNLDSIANVRAVLYFLEENKDDYKLANMVEYDLRSAIFVAIGNKVFTGSDLREACMLALSTEDIRFPRN